MPLSEFRQKKRCRTPRKINQAFGNDNVSERTVRRWLAKFCSGDFGLDDEPRSGRPTVMQDEEFEDAGGD